MDEIVIKANQLTRIYHLQAEDIHAVNKIDIEIKEGEFVALMGPSGS